MINPREMMRRLVREFVNRQLYGVIPWHTVVFDPPEELPRATGREGREDGRWREIAACTLTGGIRLQVRTPNDKPPMGEVSVMLPDGVSMAGPMAPQTWEDIGACIRKHLQEG